MTSTLAHGNYVKTSEDLMKDYYQKNQGVSSNYLGVVQINHTGRLSSNYNSHHNLSQHDLNYSPQGQNKVINQNYASGSFLNNQNDNMYPNGQINQQLARSNINQQFPQVVVSQYDNKNLGQQQNQFVMNSGSYSQRGMNNDNFAAQPYNRQENMDQINSKLESHSKGNGFKQAQSDFIGMQQNINDNYLQNQQNNKLYDSFQGKERDFDQANYRQNQQEDQIKRSYKNSDNIDQYNAKFPQDIMKSSYEQSLSSRERGQRQLEQQKRRYFTQQGPEYIRDVVQLFRNRGNYKGQVKQINGESILEGVGLIEMKNGDAYIGQFWRNYMSGDGHLIMANGDYYEGKFSNDKKHGYGIYYYNNGDIYEGYFVHDKRDSQKASFYCYTENTQYDIPYLDDKKHGKGFKKDENNNLQAIEYFQDILQQEDGKNVQNFNQSEIIDQVGIFKSNLRQQSSGNDEDKVKKAGHAKVLPEIQEDYEHQQQKEDIHSLAMQILNKIISEDAYEIYSYEKPISFLLQGQAIYKFKDGSYYAGTWTNGQQNGYGTYYDSQQGLYEGDFVLGKKQGLGLLSYLNGDTYDGIWMNDKKHDDKGVYFNFLKQERIEGKFFNGKLTEIINRTNMKDQNNRDAYNNPL